MFLITRNDEMYSTNHLHKVEKVEKEDGTYAIVATFSLEEIGLEKVELETYYQKEDMERDFKQFVIAYTDNKHWVRFYNERKKD